jgi:hypothetical protein
MFTLWIKKQSHKTEIVQAAGSNRGFTVVLEVDGNNTFAILQRHWRKHAWQWLINEQGLYRVR